MKTARFFALALAACSAHASAASVPLPPPRPVAAQAFAVPLPPRRPEEFGPPAPPAALRPGSAPKSAQPILAPSPVPPPPTATGQIVPDPFDAACTRVLASVKVLASRVPPVVGPGGCGIAFPLMLRAVVLPNGHPVTLEPPALLRCDLAEQMADWIRDDIVPIAAGKGELLAVADAAAYVCRGRNRVLGATLSEHGRGDAIDVLSFRFAGQTVALKQADAHPFWSDVKRSACARFRTVLGPGSDGFHEDNLHLDLEDRRNGSHYCHWDDP